MPEQIVAGSVFAEGGDKIEVRAVQFRSRAVGEEPREEVRKLDAAIEDLTDKIGLNKKSLELLDKRTQYLDKLEGFPIDRWVLRALVDWYGHDEKARYGDLLSWAQERWGNSAGYVQQYLFHHRRLIG